MKEKSKMFHTGGTKHHDVLDGCDGKNKNNNNNKCKNLKMVCVFNKWK
jgi:hypothetical protein